MNNIYHKIHEKKTSQELIEIIKSDDSSNESKKVSIQILKDRNELPDELQALEEKIHVTHHKEVHKIGQHGRYDTIGARIGANVIDSWIFIPVTVINKFLPLIYDDFIVMTGSLLAIILPYIYSILMHGLCGQTFGKMFMSIKIMDKSEHKKISFMQAFYRDAIPLLGLILLFIVSLFSRENQSIFIRLSAAFIIFLVAGWSILEILTLLTNKKHRALHDYIAGTTVIKMNE